MKIPLYKFKAKMEDLRLRTQVVLDEFSEMEKMYLETSQNDGAIFDVEGALGEAVYYLAWMRDLDEEEL